MNTTIHSATYMSVSTYLAIATLFDWGAEGKHIWQRHIRNLWEVFQSFHHEEYINDITPRCLMFKHTHDRGLGAVAAESLPNLQSEQNSQRYVLELTQFNR